MTRWFGVAFWVFLTPCLAAGEMQMHRAPTPGPDVQKLAYYIGTWKGHGESKGGPLAPAGRLSSAMTCDWFTGGFQVICKGHETSASGTRQFMDILSYDEQARSYREYTINNEGDSEYDQGGLLAGNAMTYALDLAGGKKPVKVRYTEVRVSSTVRTYRAEIAIGGAPWTVIAQGELDKVP